MSAKVQVKLGDGQLVTCPVIERSGYNHDIGARVIWVNHAGKRLMAVGNRGAWREWTPADRTRPLREHFARNAQKGGT